MSERTRDIIVIGGSAGAMDALTEVLRHLDADLPAAVLVTLHLHEATPRSLVENLGARSRLPVAFAAHEQPIVPGRITVAPPQQHMMVHTDRVALVSGPRENLCRPAIDPLFRSAAVAHGSAVVAAVLSGLLDDGASGLHAVRRCGGVPLVQDPADALHADMPAAALEFVPDAEILAAKDLAARINALSRAAAGDRPPVPAELQAEMAFVEHAMSNVERMTEFGSPVGVSCPSCGGPLWSKEENGQDRFRCHVGHAFSTRSLLDEQDHAVERGLWSALRTLEERSRMLDKMARKATTTDRAHLAGTLASRAAEAMAEARAVRRVITAASRRGAGGPGPADLDHPGWTATTPLTRPTPDN